MNAHPIGPAQPGAEHARWLHELRNVVSTASVAAAMARRLVRTDVDTAAELLVETESALLLCRELLASAGEHVRVDSRAAAPASIAPQRRRRTVGEEIDRNREWRGLRGVSVADAAVDPSADVQAAALTTAVRSGTHG